jgi:two-component system, cell cycle sensor histidine kinase and response regulator CckA
LRYKPEEWTNLQFWKERVHEGDRQWALKYCEECSRRGEAHDFEYRFYKKDGQVVWLKDVVHVEMENGSPVKLRGFMLDITERKQAEQALAEAILRQEEAVKAGNVGLWDWNLRTQEVYYSPEWKAQIGYEDHEIGNTFEEWESRVHPEDLGPTLERIKAFLDGKESGYQVEFRFRHKNGNYLWILAQASILRDENGQPFRTLGSHVDITRRKTAEEELQKNQETMSALLNASSDAAFMMDRQGVLLAFNEELARRMKTPHENLKGMSLYDLLPADVAKGRKERVDQVIASGEPVRFVDERQGIIIDNSFYPLFDSRGQVTRVAVFGRDITGQKATEAERERLIAAIEQAVEIIVITDLDGTIEYVNPAFETTTGYSREEAIGQNPRILKSGQQDQVYYQDLWQTITRGETWEGRMVNRRKDGSLYTEDATISAVRNSEGEIIHFVAVKRDITQFLELEKQYQQSQKMESIGQLAGGVAHDFNNLLQVINGGTYMAMDDLEPEHPARDSLEQVAKAGERAAILVGQLLAFSRRQILRPESLELNEVIAGLLKMLGRVIGEHIRLEFVRGHEVGRINADRGMIEQVLMNLCVNARDAMPGGGSLTIETRNAYLNEAFCRAHPGIQPGRYAMMQITDTGCGMDEKTLEKVFEPFFTTKEPGKGTGLGLATVYGIIQQHNGMVVPQSAPGRGTTFEIYLPISEESEQPVETGEAVAFSGGTETILLAEDDESVQLVSKSILERAGYTVLTANDGREAVEVFCRKADEIALALLDVVMPQLGGREAFERMRALRPDLKALFASGYSEDTIHTNFVLDEGISLLQKPYAPNTLLQRVRQALDA